MRKSGEGKQMTNWIKAFAERGIRNRNSIILSLYLFFVWASYLFINYYGKVNDLGFFIYLAGIFVFVTAAVGRIINKLSAFELAKKDKMCGRDKIIVFSVFALICFGILTIWYIASFPGSFSPDSRNQYLQAVSGAGYYNDWHPAWHTMVFFAFPLMLTGQASSIVLFQIIYFSLAIGYMCLFISKRAGVKWAALAMAYIMLNPYTGNILMYPWKDVGFAIAGLLSMIMAAEAVLSREQVRWWYICLLGLVLANATVFRHNGVLFTAVLTVALLFHVGKKWGGLLLASFFLALFIIKVPVYHVMGVSTNVGSRVTETVGTPMAVMGNVAKEVPWVMDAEMREFMYSLQPPEQWESRDFAGLKAHIDHTPIEETGRFKIFGWMFRCFCRATKASLRGFIPLTDVVYGLESGVEGIQCGYIIDNDYGIEYAGNRQVLAFVQNYTDMINNTVFKYFCSIGSSMVFMLFAILSKCNLGKWKDWKKLLLCLPIFTYNFGTMFLLTSRDSRFFYISFLVCPIVVTIMFAGEKEAGYGR